MCLLRNLAPYPGVSPQNYLKRLKFEIWNFKKKKKLKQKYDNDKQVKGFEFKHFWTFFVKEKRMVTLSSCRSCLIIYLCSHVGQGTIWQSRPQGVIIISVEPTSANVWYNAVQTEAEIDIKLSIHEYIWINGYLEAIVIDRKERREFYRWIKTRP